VLTLEDINRRLRKHDPVGISWTTSSKFDHTLMDLPTEQITRYGQDLFVVEDPVHLSYGNAVRLDEYDHVGPGWAIDLTVVLDKDIFPSSVACFRFERAMGEVLFYVHPSYFEFVMDDAPHKVIAWVNMP